MVKVAALKVGEDLTIIDIPKGLEPMQELVGGYIQMIHVTKDILLWMNEEGKLEGLRPNFFLLYNGDVKDYIAGDCFFSSSKEETSLTEKQIKEIKRRFMDRNYFELGE